MPKLRTRRPRREADANRTAHAGSIDLGDKPAVSEQPDPALEAHRASQTAINDASAAIYDTPSLLASDEPLLFIDRIRTWVREQQAQAELRTALGVLGAHSLAHLIRIGKDEGAAEPGIGLTATRRRLTDALSDEAQAEEVVAAARRDLDHHGAHTPAAHDRRALLTTWLRTSWYLVAAVALEGVLLATALDLAVASEDPWEKWGLAGLTLFGTVGVTHAVADLVRRIRYGEESLWYRPVIGLGILTTLALIAAVSHLRNLAIQVDTSTDTWGGDGSFATPANLTWVFALMMLGMMASVFLLTLASHAPEQLTYIRATRARDRSRARASRTEDAVASIESRLALQDLDIEETRKTGDHYAASGLPALGDFLVAEYVGELARRVADPTFTDALRAAAPNWDARLRPADASHTLADEPTPAEK